MRQACPWDKDGRLLEAEPARSFVAHGATVAAPVHAFRKFASTTADDMGEC